MGDDGDDPKGNALSSLQAVIQRVERQTNVFRRLRMFDSTSPLGKALAQQARIAELVNTTAINAPRPVLGAKDWKLAIEAERERERTAKETEREAIQESASALRELAAATRYQTGLAWKVGIVSAIIGAIVGAVLTRIVQ